MITKTEFFAMLNDANNQIGVTAHIAAIELANGHQELIIRQNGAPNTFLSKHKAHSTTIAAFTKYNAWLNEWFTAQPETAQAEALEMDAEIDAAKEVMRDAAFNAYWLDCDTMKLVKAQAQWHAMHAEALEVNEAMGTEAQAEAELFNLLRYSQFWGGMDYAARRDAVEEAHTEALGMNAAFDNSFHRRAAHWGAMDAMSRWIELEKAEALAHAMNWQIDFYAQPDHKQAFQVASHHAVALEIDAARNKTTTVRGDQLHAGMTVRTPHGDLEIADVKQVSDNELRVYWTTGQIGRSLYPHTMVTVIS